MAYTPLTKEAKEFVRKECSGNGNSLLVGKNRSGGLPFCLPDAPEGKSNYIWTSTPIWTKDGKKIIITTNQVLGEAIIDWYDKYGKEFKMNSNFLLAQAFCESGFRMWDYPQTSTASGLCQFISTTTFDLGIQSNSEYDKYAGVGLTDGEKALLIMGIQKAGSLESYYTNTNIGKANRPKFHQNVINNPEIMVKLQFRYMKYIANKFNDLASVTLFGYSRGQGHAKKTYAASIESAKNRGDDYHIEGIKYVYNIFKTVYDNFGSSFSNLGMNMSPSEAAKTFDTGQANIDDNYG